MDLEKLKYPIGKAKIPNNITDSDLAGWIRILEIFPKRLSKLVNGLNEEQLDTPYRPGGWTIRQVVHHIADSHTHSYIRFKWALTEEEPVIKPYYEDRWAELEDASNAPISVSLEMIKAVHAKLVLLMKGMDKVQWKRCFIHPEGDEKVSLEQNAGKYAWHAQHHYAHIENLIRSKGWI